MKILCIGDSITAGIGGTVGNAYPDVMLRIMEKKTGQVTVINEGRPGDSTKDYHNYLKTTKETISNLEEIIAWFKPEVSYDVIIIMIGSNDCRTDNWVETKDSLIFIKGIIEMSRSWVDDEDEIVLSSLIPLADPMPPRIVGGAHRWYQERIEKELNPGIREIAKKGGHSFIDMHGIFTQGLEEGWELYDGIHPYNEGYKLMGEAFAGFLIERFL